MIDFDHDKSAEYMNALNWRDLMQEFRLMGDFGDAWGTTMGAWFDVAAELYNRGADIPAEWRYRPGACSGAQEVSDYWAEIFKAYSDAELLKFGRILNRYAGVLKTAGRDY